MRKILFAVAMLWACTSSAQTIYSWPGDGRPHIDMSYNMNTAMRLTVPANTTEVSIVSSTHEPNGGDIVDIVSVMSGPNPIAGEWIDVPQGFQFGLFEILSATQNSDGTWTLVENQATDEGFAVHTGSAFLGPGLQYSIFFTGQNWSTAVCNSATSSVDAGYLDANGNLQGAQSVAGTVTCHNSSTDGGVTVKTVGTFTTATGQSVSFGVTNKNGRYGRYAQAAAWTVSQPAAFLYPCGSQRKDCLAAK